MLPFVSTYVAVLFRTRRRMAEREINVAFYGSAGGTLLAWKKCSLPGDQLDESGPQLERSQRLSGRLARLNGHVVRAGPLARADQAD